MPRILSIDYGQKRTGIAVTDEFQIIASGLTNTVLVGGDFGKINHPFLYFENAENAAIWARENCPENSMILIKGSRSTKMEKIMQAL